MIRFDSVNNVNRKLPEIEHIFETISELNEKSISLTKDIHELFSIWGKQLQSKNNPDHDYYMERKMKKSMLNKKIQTEINKIYEHGGMIKDINQGLVDFFVDDPSIVDKVKEVTEGSYEGIFLCWKVGEKRIEHWHPAKEGFSKRRPIKEILEATFV